MIISIKTTLLLVAERKIFMNKEELLKLKNIKQKELEEIDKQLDEIYDREFAEAEDYIEKYYRLNDSNIYFHVNGYNPNKGELYGTEICFMQESLDTYHEECRSINKEKFTEVSKEDMEKAIREHIEFLVEEFMK